MSAELLKPFALYDADGALIYLGLHPSEQAAWQIALGWPSQHEIETAKSRGLTLRRVWLGGFHNTPEPA